ncbi:hypothetical protein BGZ73_006873 [Actinomortierella ambigua]|nr:hypothetical protein BGZ73_006873 [Actinomortierella ambigua]
MSGRNRRGNTNTYVNNVRGPTSALTSFLNERGIRRANPAPRPAPTADDPQVSETPTAEVEEEESNAAEQDSQTEVGSSSTSAITRRTRVTRASSSATSSNTKSAGKEPSEEDSSDDSDSSAKNPKQKNGKLVSLSLASSRPRRNAAASSSSAAASSSSKAESSANATKKRPRKKVESDDSDYELDITGSTPRSRFSHKGRAPLGSNKIEFCSRCRARFTIKAGTVPVTDDSGGILCPTCVGTEANPSASASKPKPAKRPRRKAQKQEIERYIPTLQDLCIKKIAEYIEDVEAFGDISDISMDKICKIICRNRSLSNKTLPLFLDPRHIDVSFYDCTEIAPEALQSIASFCPDIRSLQLTYCGRITDDVINYYAKHLTQLKKLSLTGPFLVTDAAYADFFRTVGSRLEQFDLDHSARFNISAMESLATHCPHLKQLTLGDCMHLSDNWLPWIAKLNKLESLTIRNPEHDLSTDLMIDILKAVGGNLQNLELTNCASLEDKILSEGVRELCPNLRRLTLASCEELSSEAFVSLFTDWKANSGLLHVDVSGCVGLKDEALEAIVTHNAHALETLNLSNDDELTSDGLKPLLRCEYLKRLDVSWVRAFDDELMGALIKAAPKLNQVTVWGDHRLTEYCPTRPGLRIVGREADYIDLRF